MASCREGVGSESAQIDGQTGDAEAKVVESIDVLETSFDVIAAAAKKLRDGLADSISQVVTGRGFEPGSDVEIAHTNGVVGREESLGFHLWWKRY